MKMYEIIKEKIRCAKPYAVSAGKYALMGALIGYSLIGLAVAREADSLEEVIELITNPSMHVLPAGFAGLAALVGIGKAGEE